MALLQLCSIKYTKSENIKLNGFLSTLYKDLNKSCEYLKNVEIQINKSNNTKDIFIKNKYFPQEIYTYITSNTYKKFVYTAEINGKNINLKFLNFNIPVYTEKVLFNYSKIIFIIIHLLSFHTNKSCSKNLYINIYLTPYKKKFPINKSDIIGVDNVNSGFSNIGCQNTSEITIYREEE